MFCFPGRVYVGGLRVSSQGWTGTSTLSGFRRAAMAGLAGLPALPRRGETGFVWDWGARSLCPPACPCSPNPLPWSGPRVQRRRTGRGDGGCWGHRGWGTEEKEVSVGVPAAGQVWGGLLQASLGLEGRRGQGGRPGNMKGGMSAGPAGLQTLWCDRQVPWPLVRIPGDNPLLPARGGPPSSPLPGRCDRGA